MNTEKYSISILTSFSKVKSTTDIAEESNVSQSKASRFLKNLNNSALNFKTKIKLLFGNSALNFIIDDFVISKRYANNTEGLSILKDQSTKTYTKGTSIVAGGLGNGKYFLPLDLQHWIAKWILGEESYKSKIELAKLLISKAKSSNLNIQYHVLDGLYFSQLFLEWLQEEKLKFVIKAKTTTVVEYKGKKYQLKNCPGLRLNSNQSHKKIAAYWHGKMYYFIAIKRSGKHGEKIIYLVANFCTKTLLYRKIYDSRWSIEKFIRTGKQHIGLKDSQSRIAQTYLNHIKCVFYAYGILQVIMKKFRLKSSEEALRKVQAWRRVKTFEQTFDQISLLVTYA